jgi:pantoate--beta-alanine ligase
MRQDESSHSAEAPRGTSDRGGAPALDARERLAVAIVGAGRAGGSLARAAEAAGLEVRLAGRDDAGDACAGAAVALICVPDAEIEAACAALAAAGPPPLVGHVSGATGLDALSSAAERGAQTFSLHPLQTIPDPETDLTGAPCAVSGSTREALELADALARRLGLLPFPLDDADRVAYHAAASIASNFLVALEESAAELLERTGVENARELLSPLVLRTAANWSERGAEALTGPIARGDTATIERHLGALRERAPELVPAYEALAERARAIVARPAHPSGSGGGDAMKVVRTKSELADVLSPARRQGRTIGLVPTMGALHEGHLSLLRAARERCDVVVMSLFVNPAQFAAGEDLESYPRDEDRDLALAGGEGVDLVYAPSAEEVYPPRFSTTVEVAGLTDVLCGSPRSRGREHFRGVTTVVAKLLNSVAPDVAFFGQKDAQQAIVIRRMAADLDFPVEIAVLPTVRESDGLAMSSRNAYLRPDDRERAAALSRALGAAAARAADGAALEAALDAARAELDASGIEPEYLEARDAEDLSSVSSLNGRPVLVAVAARVGDARLIDNTVIGGSQS